MTLSRQLELASRKGFVSSCKSFVLSAVIYVRNVTTDTYGKVCIVPSMYVTNLVKILTSVRVSICLRIRFVSPPPTPTTHHHQAIPFSSFFFSNFTINLTSKPTQLPKVFHAIIPLPNEKLGNEALSS